MKPPRRERTDLCRECKVENHQTCGMKRDCVCCDDTRQKMAETESG